MLSGLLSLLRESHAYAAIREAVSAPRPAWIQGPSGAEKGYLLAALFTDPALAPATVVIATPSRDAAGRLTDDLALFSIAMIIYYRRHHP